MFGRSLRLGSRILKLTNLEGRFRLGNLITICSTSYLNMESRFLSIVTSEKVNLQVGSYCESIASNDIDSDVNPNVYSKMELEPGPEMLKRITSDLRKINKIFILPFGDDDAIKKILKPFELFIQQGVRPEFLIDACVKRSEIFEAFSKRGKHCYDLIEVLVDTCEITFEDGIRLFAYYKDDLLSVDLESIVLRLQVVIDCGVLPGLELSYLVKRCPMLLFASDDKKMRNVVHGLSSFFSRAQLTELVTKLPYVLLSDLNEMELKYEYIFFHMCMEPKEFVNCKNWVVTPLEHIMMRHEFLLKTGTYTTPDPKRPQLKKENPTLDMILDSSDERFAIYVAKVTVEEWNVYKSLHEKLKLTSGLERPYQRIKPSMRKKYERRKKNQESLQLSEFDPQPDD